MAIAYPRNRHFDWEEEEKKSQQTTAKWKTPLANCFMSEIVLKNTWHKKIKQYK